MEFKLNQVFGLVLRAGTRRTYAHSSSLADYYFQPIFHIWERKYFKSNGFFFTKFAKNLCLTLRVLPIEFNSHKLSFVRYVFVEIFGVFLKRRKWPLNDEMTPKMTKIPKFLNFLTFLCNFCHVFERHRIRMLKTFNRARIHSPIVFYEEINAILYQKIDPKNDKNSKIF